MKCTRCKAKAVVALPRHNAGFCRNCFLEYFSRQVQKAISKHKMFGPKDKILIALSGGKDSLALALQLKLLGYNVSCLHLDLDIPNSSKPILSLVQKFAARFELPLFVLHLKQEGLSIPKVKAKLSRPICSACGQIKRYYFNQFALENNFKVLATGHNLDDEVARLFANTLRWDLTYLGEQSPVLKAEHTFVTKVKPLYRLTEFETAVFCFLQNIDYSLQACPYSQGASFSFYKKLFDQLEEHQPGRKLNFYESFLEKALPVFGQKQSPTTLKLCPLCAYPTSGEICGVCRIKNICTPHKNNL